MRGFPEEVRAKIKRLGARGLSLREIADTVGCAPGSVHRVLNPDSTRAYRERQRWKEMMERKRKEESGYVEVPPEVLAERDERLSRQPRDLTALLMGDPV